MKKTMSLAMGAALIASSVTPVLAAEQPATQAKPGFYNIETGVFTSVADFKKLDKKGKQELFKQTYFSANGSVYKSLDIITKTNEELKAVVQTEEEFEKEHKVELTDKGQVIKDGEVVTPEQPPTDLEVKTVSAINDTVVDSSSDSKQVLGFTINDGKEVTVAELEEEGYEVEFLTSKDVLSESEEAVAGELDNSKLTAAGTSFKYQVQISKDEEVVATSELATVKVENFATVVTAITKVVPVVNTQEKASNTVTEGDTVSFKVYGHLKNNPEKEVDVTAQVTSVKSSKSTVLYVSGNTATAVTAGTATVTVKAGEVEASQVITIVASAKVPAAETLSADLTSVEVVKQNKKTIKVTVLDQYGDAVVSQTVTASSDDTDVATVDADASKSTNDKGVAEFAVTGVAKGTAKITFTINGKTLEVPVQVLEAGEVATYALKGEKEFDIVDGATQNYYLQGYDESGLESGSAALLPTSTSGEVYYKVETSNKDVATAAIDTNQVVVTGKTAGTVTITLSKYEGKLATPTATYTKEITIDDTRANLTGATLVKEADLPTFTSNTLETELTADLSEVIEKLSFLPGTTAYKLVQGDDATVIKIVDTNSEVANNVLGTVEVKAVGSTDVDAEIAPKVGDAPTDATITLDVDYSTADAKTGAVIVNVKDADGNIVADVALDINIVIPVTEVAAESLVWHKKTPSTKSLSDEAFDVEAGVATLTAKLSDLIADKGDAPNEAKWAGLKIEAPSGATQAIVDVTGSNPRTAMEEDATNTELDDNKTGFFYFFPVGISDVETDKGVAVEEGISNVNNLTITWLDENDKIVKVETLTVNFVPVAEDSAE